MVHDEWRNRGISWFLSYLVCHVCRNTEHCPPFTPHRCRDGFRGTLANVARIVHRAMRFTGMYSFGLVCWSRAGKSRKSYQNTGSTQVHVPVLLFTGTISSTVLLWKYLRKFQYYSIQYSYSVLPEHFEFLVLLFTTIVIYPCSTKFL